MSVVLEVCHIVRLQNTSDGNPRLSVTFKGDEPQRMAMTAHNVQAASYVLSSYDAHGQTPEGLQVRVLFNSRGQIIRWEEQR